MIFLFLIDTSASMNQKFTNGFTVLDCAKNGVDHFIKVSFEFFFKKILL